MTLKIDINKVRNLSKKLLSQPKFILVCDSRTFEGKRRMGVDYARAVVIHIDGNRGCKVFGDIIRERILILARSLTDETYVQKFIKIANYIWKLPMPSETEILKFILI